MPEEEKKERIVPMDDKEFTGGSPGPLTEKEKAKFRALMEMYNVYSEDNPQPIAPVEVPTDFYSKAESQLMVPVFRSIEPVVLTLTWDATYRDIDLSSQTSNTARWAMVSVYFMKAADFTDDFYWRENGRTLPCVRLTSDHIGRENYRVGGMSLVPLDRNQIVEYNAPANTNIRSVVIYGYIEIGRIRP